MSPYIVTTKKRWDDSATNTGGYIVQSRLAVATLEEARQRVFEIAEDIYGIGRSVEAQVDACRSLTESGGTVGPLPPDGTVIEVTPLDREGMRRLAAATQRVYAGPHSDPAIIDAYNAAQAPRECGQPLYRAGERVGTCREPWGTEHDHG